MTTILFTDMFPFSKAEPFLIEEIPFHKNKLIIIPTYCGKAKEIRKLNILHAENLSIRRPQSAFFKNNLISRTIYALLSITRKLFWLEVIELYKSNKLTFQRLAQLLSFISRAYKLKNYVEKKILCENNITSNILIYSYWMNSASLAGIILKHKYPNIKIVARCHGYDLYERKENNFYVTMQKYLVNNIDRIFSVSNDGLSLIKSKVENIEPKIFVSKLGTKDFGISRWTKDNKKLHVVSCSSVIPLKRVHLIVKALAKVEGIDILWTHFGSGTLLNEVKEYAKTVDNVFADFKGHCDQNDIFNFYKNNNIDLFINVSESEGLPVSIMEAISFGIPVIAPDVGGIKEIVFNGENGWLLKKDFLIEELSEHINSYIKMDKYSIMKIRENARRIWCENYNSQINYTDFIKQLTIIGTEYKI